MMAIKKKIIAYRILCALVAFIGLITVGASTLSIYLFVQGALIVSGICALITVLSAWAFGILVREAVNLYLDIYE